MGRVIEGLTNTLRRTEEALNLVAHSALETQSISSGVLSLQAKSKDQELEEFLQWLSPLEPMKRHQDIRAHRVHTTGGWLLETSQFRAWHDGTLQGSGHVIACYGIPGAGKTFITSSVIDHLSEEVSQGRVGIAFLYCDYRDQKDQLSVNMIGCLLKQFIIGLLELPDAVAQIYRQQKRQRQKLELADAGKMLGLVLKSFNRAYICIDALDECEGSERREFLKQLKPILHGSCRLFITGRPHIRDDVNIEIKSAATIEIVASEEDIKNYIIHEIQTNKEYEPDAMDVKLEHEIVSAVVAASQGMYIAKFLLPALQIKTVLEQPTKYSRRAALRRIPKDLHDAFREALQRIERQPEGKSERGMKALMLIHLARVPLSIKALQHALAVKPGDVELDEDDIVSSKSLLECCMGLIMIDEETATLRLVHFSLQQYLHHDAVFNQGHRDMARICLTYLNFHCFEGSLESIRELSENFAFIRYAAENWGHHVRLQSDQLVETMALELLRNRSCLPYVCQVLSRFLGSPSQPPTVHIAAYFGIRTLVSSLALEGGGFENKYNRGRTPLSYAAEQGHEETGTVRLLLEQGGFDVNLRGTSSWAPLWVAARWGNQGVVQVLLKKDEINVNSRCGPGSTPLFAAATHGHDGVVQLLLGRSDVDVDSKSSSGCTPLYIAAVNNREEVV
ncbi:ankyrin, partial [Wilcoxina mikolae CBS 423.85]